jgi:hypothetical protein
MGGLDRGLDLLAPWFARLDLGVDPQVELPVLD